MIVVCLQRQRRLTAIHCSREIDQFGHWRIIPRRLLPTPLGLVNDRVDLLARMHDSKRNAHFGLRVRSVLSE